MRRIISAVVVGLVVGWAWMGWAGLVSPEGLELVRFELKAPPKPKVGDKVEIVFELRNVSTHPVRFHDRFGVFVGARYYRPGHRRLNRDFGYCYKGATLAPGRSIIVHATQILDMPGFWAFWPAYNVGGRWGPFDSVKKVIEVKAFWPTHATPEPGGGKTVVVWKGKYLPLQVFPPDNSWNQPVDHLRVHPRSKQFIANIGAYTSLHPDFGSGNGKPFGIPYTVVRAGQPKVPVKFKWASESDPGPYPIPDDAPVERGPDRHVIVIDYDAKKLYELFRAFKTPTGWRALAGAVFDLTSNKLRPLGFTSADAAGLPIFPGLVRYEEIAKLGRISHALRFTARKTRAAYILPATHFASKLKDPRLPPMGLRVRLKATFDITPFPPTVQVILRALKKYGMILADNGGNWFISGAPSPYWNDDELAWLKRVKGKDLEVVYTGEAMTGGK